MVSIKSLIVFTFAAFAVASPILNGGAAGIQSRDIIEDTIQKSGNKNDFVSPKSKQDDTVNAPTNAMNCGNNHKISCCNTQDMSKSDVTSLLNLDLKQLIEVSKCAPIAKNIPIAGTGIGGTVNGEFPLVPLLSTDQLTDLLPALSGNSKDTMCETGPVVCCPVGSGNVSTPHSRPAPRADTNLPNRTSKTASSTSARPTSPTAWSSSVRSRSKLNSLDHTTSSRGLNRDLMGGLGLGLGLGFLNFPLSPFE
ncbi:hypothetical protein BZA05DRAFT_411981 [Tricharina praecox]|uniref:uncharacterized protein n=1 Tax=Tricharina praecox TaxID=43433 RepID=UPI00221F0C80|nr:uncharacterized protein BZA05DRAFT_411981 [Tricharina praecox]KAI5842695.1 hypothetical protein BZA05DRAFT_411981 [Tricharina praecox]